MNDHLREAARVDPAWARREQRKQIILILSTAGAVIAIALAAYGIAVNVQQDTRITKVERSACAQDAESLECQRIKRESDEARSVADSCVAFQKVDRNGKLLRLTRCEVGEAGAVESPRQGEAAGGTDEASSANGPSVPDQFPGVRGASAAPGEGDSAGGHGGGHDSPPKPSQPSPVAESGGHSEGQPAAPETAPTSTQPQKPVLESVSGVVTETGSAVNGLLCGVQERLLGTCP